MVSKEKKEKEKEKFILSEIMTLTLAATLQRNKVYKKGTNDKKRLDFRNSLKEKLITLSDKYKRGKVSCTAHMENISRLSHQISEDYKDILDGGRFKIGAAQKALNMYLKYLWCLNMIPPKPEPPHCPIDAIILKKAKIYGVAWTKIDCIDEYKELIEKVKDIAKKEGLSLAKWELDKWGGDDE